jgi:hypothetical protein
MISDSDAQELHHCIGSALNGDLAGLTRAQQISHELLTVHLPAWRWETTAAGVALADPTVATSERAAAVCPVEVPSPGAVLAAVEALAAVDQEPLPGLDLVEATGRPDSDPESPTALPRRQG